MTNIQVAGLLRRHRNRVEMNDLSENVWSHVFDEQRRICEDRRYQIEKTLEKCDAAKRHISTENSDAVKHETAANSDSDDQNDSLFDELIEVVDEKNASSEVK